MADDQKKPPDNGGLPKTQSPAPAPQPAGVAAPKAASPAQPAKAAVPPAALAAIAAARSAANSPAVNVASLNLEDGVISEKVPVLMVAPLNETAMKLRTRFETEQSATINVHEAQGNTCASMAKQLIPCLIIASIINNNDIVKLLNILKVIKDDVKANRIKFIVFSKIKSPPIIKTFESLGCHEYIVEPINERSLGFKMNLQTKSLSGLRKQMRKQELEAKEGKGSVKKLSGGQNAAQDDVDAESAAKTKMAEAVENESDCWVFKKNKPKKAGGKWTMRMKGPDPGDGDWVETGKDEEGHSKWRFVEKDENGKPVDPKDAGKKPGWEFTGDKPQFQNGEWGFQGEKPDLSFVDEKGDKKGSKMKSDGADGLVLAEDSEAAKKADKAREEKEAAKKDQKKKALFNKDKGAGEGLDDEDLEAAGKEGEKKKPGAGMDFGDLEDEPEGAADLKFQEEKHGLDINQKKSEDEPGKKTDNTGLAGMAMNFEDEEPEFNDKLTPEQKAEAKKKKEQEKKDGKDQKKNSKNAAGFLDDDALEEAGESMSSGEKKDPTGTAKKADEKKTGKKEEKKTDNTGLAGMAMNFEDEDPEFNDKLTPEQKAEAKKKKEQATKAQGKAGQKKEAGVDFGFEEDEPEFNGLPDAEKKKDAKSAKGDKKGKGPSANDFEDADDSDAEGDGEEGSGKKTKNKADGAGKKSKGKKPGGSVDFEDDEDDGDADDAGESEDGEETDSDAELGAGEKNFLKKKKKPKFEDESGEGEDERGEFHAHKSTEEKKKGWKGHDSGEEGESEPGEDKLIEIDSPNGSLKSKKNTEGEVYEYPGDHFGHPDGVWEPAGSDPKDRSKTKVAVYVHPDLRMGKIKTLQDIAPWWIFRGERPIFLSSKKVWQCKGAKPEKFDDFKDLPAFVREYLLSIFKSAQDDAQFADTPEAKAEDAAGKKTLRQNQGFVDEDDGAETGDAPALDDDLAGEVVEEAAVSNAQETQEEGSAAPAAAEKKRPPLPTPPMMAVFISEILLSSRGDALKALAYFAGSLSSGFDGVEVTVFAASGGESSMGRVVASTTERHVYNADIDLNTLAGFSQANAEKKPQRDGRTLLCPVTASQADAKFPIGFVLIDKIELGSESEDQTRYLSTLSQCLRGPLSQIVRELTASSLKEAA